MRNVAKQGKIVNLIAFPPWGKVAEALTEAG